jgi:flagellar protein FliO/FliZ
MDATQSLQPILALLLVLALLLGAAWAARRLGWVRNGSAGKHIKVVASHSLGGRSFISVIEVDGVKLAVGITPQNITLLHQFQAEATPPAPAFKLPTNPADTQP